MQSKGDGAMARKSPFSGVPKGRVLCIINRNSSSLRDAAKRGLFGHRAFAIGCIFLFTGCGYINIPLNNGNVRLENRVKNHTLSETFSEVQPTGNPAATQAEIFATCRC